MKYVIEAVILTVVFFVVLVPMAAVRRLFTPKQKENTSSSFIQRNYRYTAKDLANPW